MGFFQKHKQLKIWLTAFAFVAVVIIFEKFLTGLPDVLGAIGKFFSILAPFIAGFVIAFILYIPSNKLEHLLLKVKFLKKGKLARATSLAITYIVFITAISLLISYILPMLFTRLSLFIKDDLPYYYDKLNELIDNMVVDGKIYGISVSKLTPFLDYDWLISNVDVTLLTTLSQGIVKVGSAVVDVFLAVVSSIYMLAAREKHWHIFRKFFSLFFKPKRLQQTTAYLKKIGSIFYSYIYSQLLDATVVAVLLSIVFSIVGVPYAVLFGVLLGICNLVPYFGAIVGGFVVTLITLLSDGFIKALITLALILIVQQIDGNIIQPKIVGDKIGIHPLYILIAITVGWGLFGFLGMLIGIPIMATIRMILVDIIAINDKKRKADEPQEPEVIKTEVEATQKE